MHLKCLKPGNNHDSKTSLSRGINNIIYIKIRFFLVLRGDSSCNTYNVSNEMYFSTLKDGYFDILLLTYGNQTYHSTII